MNNKVALLLESMSLFCPDDSTPLEYRGDQLGCSACGREYPIHDGELIELLPTAPTIPSEFASGYAADYAEEFARPFKWNSAAVAWGAAENFPPHWVERRKRQARWAASLLVGDEDTSQQSFCDLSGGAGYYSLEYAKQFKRVLHCDLSVDSLNYVCFKARSLGISNIVFLRIDYFRPPFKANIDRMLCFDTLIRGEAHEKLLLESVHRCLSPKGVALVDFHNWWHNPARRLGLMKKNFPRGSYTRRQLKSLLRESGMGRYEFFPFCQEFEQSGIVGKLGSKIIPATRLVYRCHS